MTFKSHTRLQLIFAASAVLLAHPASGELIASDSFDTYSVGTRLGSATGSPVGLVGEWDIRAGVVAAAVDMRVGNSSLSHSGVASSGGSVESFRAGSGGGGPLAYSSDFNSSLEVDAGESLYFSALVNISGGTTGAIGVKFDARSMFGFGINDSGQAAIFSGDAFSQEISTVQTFAADTTYLLVGKMLGVSGGASGDAETIQLVGLYAAGDSLDESGAPLLTQTTDVYFPDDTTNAPGNTGGQTLSRLGIFLSKSTDGVTGTLDEIRVGTTFADVVPEPGTLTLLALAISIGGYRRRTRSGR